MASAFDDGRRVDVLVFHSRSQDTRLDLQLRNEDEIGLVVTGMRKLAQNWILLFLHGAEETPFNEERGTYFVSEVRGGNVRTDDDLVGAFYRAELRVRRQLASTADAADHSDELLDRAELEEASVDVAVISLRVNLVSLAGETREIIVPVRLSI